MSEVNQYLAMDFDKLFFDLETQFEYLQTTQTATERRGIVVQTSMRRVHLDPAFFGKDFVAGVSSNQIESFPISNCKSIEFETAGAGKPAAFLSVKMKTWLERFEPSQILLRSSSGQRHKLLAIERDAFVVASNINFAVNALMPMAQVEAFEIQVVDN